MFTCQLTVVIEHNTGGCQLGWRSCRNRIINPVIARSIVE
jgi:hypothetical protein